MITPELLQFNAHQQQVFGYICHTLKTQDEVTAEKKLLLLFFEEEHKQPAETFLGCALLDEKFKDFCSKESLNDYWKTYITAQRCKYVDGNENYQWIPRPDLPLFTQAVAIFSLSKTTQHLPNTEEYATWINTAIEHGSWLAAFYKIITLKNQLSPKRDIKKNQHIIKIIEAVINKIAIIHLTPGYLLFAYAHTVIGNFYHCLAETEPTYTILKKAHYQQAYQAYLFAETLSEIETSKIATQNAAFGQQENLAEIFHARSFDEAKERLIAALPDGFVNSQFFKEAHEKTRALKANIESPAFALW